MGFRLRRFRAGDAPALLHLFRDTIRRVNCRDYGPEQIAAWAHDDIDVNRWESILPERCTIVAEQGEQVIGFADMERDGHLDHFFVHADYQRNKVGSTIMNAVLEEADRGGIRRVFSEVSITARPFFEHHGFVVTEERTFLHRGVLFRNFRMERNAPAPRGR